MFIVQITLLKKYKKYIKTQRVAGMEATLL